MKSERIDNLSKSIPALKVSELNNLVAAYDSKKSWFRKYAYAHPAVTSLIEILKGKKPEDALSPNELYGLGLLIYQYTLSSNGLSSEDPEAKAEIFDKLQDRFTKPLLQKIYESSRESGLNPVWNISEDKLSAALVEIQKLSPDLRDWIQGLNDDACYRLIHCVYQSPLIFFIDLLNFNIALKSQRYVGRYHRSKGLYPGLDDDRIAAINKLFVDFDNVIDKIAPLIAGFNYTHDARTGYEISGLAPEKIGESLAQLTGILEWLRLFSEIDDLKPSFRKLQSYLVALTAVDHSKKIDELIEKIALARSEIGPSYEDRKRAYEAANADYEKKIADKKAELLSPHTSREEDLKTRILNKGDLFAKAAARERSPELTSLPAEIAALKVELSTVQTILAKNQIKFDAYSRDDKELASSKELRDSQEASFKEIHRKDSKLAEIVRKLQDLRSKLHGIAPHTKTTSSREAMEELLAYQAEVSACLSLLGLAPLAIDGSPSPEASAPPAANGGAGRRAESPLRDELEVPPEEYFEKADLSAAAVAATPAPTAPLGVGLPSAALPASMTVVRALGAAAAAAAAAGAPAPASASAGNEAAEDPVNYYELFRSFPVAPTGGAVASPAPAVESRTAVAGM